jgi:LacI family transcriptional regulator
MDNNIPFDESHIFFISDYYFEEGQVVFKRMERLFPETDAVFCAAGDIVATGIMLEAKKSGKSIPKEMAIIGYDDFIASAMISPSLTTVHQPLTQIGKDSYLTILRMLNKEDLGTREFVYSPFLVRREST